MNVCHLTYDMRIGGTEQVILNIIRGDFSSEVNHSILCIESPLGPFAEKAKQYGINVDVIPRKDGFDFSLIYKIRQYFKKQNIDILHCHQYTPWSYGALASVGLSNKIIFTEHGRFYPDKRSPKRKVINPILCQFTDHITAISLATKRALVDFEYISEKKIDVIYNGIEYVDLKKSLNESYKQLSQELCLESEDLILGTIARFDPIKNHELMIKACAELNTQGISCTLIIVGDGENRKAIERCIYDNQIKHKVKLTGYKPSPQIYFEIFDIFLLTSFSEGTSMTLLEAISYGKPSIVTDVGGNAEIIQDGKQGLVIESNNLLELTQAIKQLSNKNIRNTLGKDAQKRFNQLFCAEIMNRQYQSLYYGTSSDETFSQCDNASI